MSERICKPGGLCHCNDTVTCPVCAKRTVEAGCDGLCEECYLTRESSCRECGAALAANGKCPDCGFDYTEPAEVGA
jgi:hypothetical protein